MPDTPAGVTLFPVVSVTSFFANGPGAFLYVQKDRALDAHIGLRVQELSRQAGTWGTELPVVREGDFYERTFELSDVPISAGFRSLLRVYSLSPAFGESVRMRVYAINPDRHYLSPAPAMDTLLVDELIQLSGGYRQISLDSTPGIQSGDVVRIEIDPVASNSAIWAFVSVTNNETEQVTTITPR